MINDENYFRELAAKKKLSYNFVIKEHALMEVLPKLYNLNEKIILKGGTALNQIYLGDFQRFSEDLDFDIFKNVTVDKLKKQLIELGINIKKTIYRPGRISFESSYVVGNTKDSIRIEFNIEKNKSLETKAVSKTASSNIASYTVANIKTYPLETLIVQKLIALANRNEGKDYYDLFYAMKLVNNTDLEKELDLWKKTGVITKDFLFIAITKIDKIDMKILQKTNPFIPSDKRIDWKIIKEDLKRMIKLITN